MDPKLFQCMHCGHCGGDEGLILIMYSLRVMLTFCRRSPASLIFKMCPRYFLDTDGPDLIFCPGCYTKPPSGTMQTFWRTFSMGRSWSTYLNFTSNYQNTSTHSELECITQLYLQPTSIPPNPGTSTRATHGAEAQFTLQPQPSPRCAFASLYRFSHCLASPEADTDYAND